MKRIVFCSIISLAVAFLVPDSQAREKSEAFIVSFFDDHVKVISPDLLSKDSYVIIKNKTLSKLVARLEAPIGNIIEQVAIQAQDQASYSLASGVGKQIFLVPLSPASQEVELIIGKMAYEIPAKNQN